MRTRTDKTRAALASLLALSLAGVGCTEAKADKSARADSSATAAVPMPKTDRMPMADFKKLYAKNDVVVVDVRSHEAYVGGHIPGALSMPEESITEARAEELRRMGKSIATYCSWQAEHTSARAAQTLQKMGVPAQAVVGGLNLWFEEKNPLKTGPDPK